MNGVGGGGGAVLKTCCQVVRAHRSLDPWYECSCYECAGEPATEGA